MASGPADAENLSHDAQTVKRGGWHEAEPIDSGPPRPKGYIKGRFLAIRDDLLDDELVTPHMLAVYCAIARHASWDTGVAYPSIETIGRLAGCSRPVVCRCIGTLEALGYLQRKSRRSQHRTTLYYLTGGLPK